MFNPKDYWSKQQEKVWEPQAKFVIYYPEIHSCLVSNIVYKAPFYIWKVAPKRMYCDQEIVQWNLGTDGKETTLDRAKASIDATVERARKNYEDSEHVETIVKRKEHYIQ